MEFRVGRVISVKKHPEAEKLYIEEVDVVGRCIHCPPRHRTATSCFALSASFTYLAAPHVTQRPCLGHAEAPGGGNGGLHPKS